MFVNSVCNNYTLGERNDPGVTTQRFLYLFMHNISLFSFVLMQFDTCARDSVTHSQSQHPRQIL